jgi:hypothetical protein
MAPIKKRQSRTWGRPVVRGRRHPQCHTVHQGGSAYACPKAPIPCPAAAGRHAAWVLVRGVHVYLVVLQA